ncbi:MAG: peptidylprolyl isomerase [Planctomycetaceae bacterium]|nr:peptidylprolyl isomerase [Planctomycetaceae bacterium]
MSSLVRAAVVATALMLCCSPAFTQNDSASPAATAADWPALIQERDAKLAALQTIRTKLPDAQGQEAVDLRAEGGQLLDEIFNDLFPRMRASAIELLKGDAVDEASLNEIAELAYRTFKENKFAEAGALADAMLVKAPDNAIALNVAGVSHFATEDFERSAELLNSAQERNLLIQELGAQYIDTAANYVGYWKEELALRERDAQLPEAERLPRVELDTTRGKIVVELFENEAPNTVANFISLVESGFYDGTEFHRVLPTFMAQGGDPNSKPGATGQPGTGGPGYTIKCEWDQPNSRRHFAGTLSMAHAGRDTGGSQFFLTHLPTAHLDKDFAVPAGRDAHTVFGRVVEGMDVVLTLRVNDAITSARVLNKRDHEYKPETTPEPQP